MKKSFLISHYHFQLLYQQLHATKMQHTFPAKQSFLTLPEKLNVANKGKGVVKISKTHILLDHIDDDNDVLSGEISALA